MPRSTWPWLIFSNAIFAAAVGAVAVVLPLFYVIVLPVWLGTLLWSGRGLDKRAVTRLLTQVTIMVLIIVGAIIAPVKTTDRFLEHTIDIPKTVMTLAEIEGEPNGLPPEWLPRRLHVSVAPDERSQAIAFSSTTLTLRDFIIALETQSTLRHRFGHCGNGSTILWGGDCSFGLHLQRPLD